MNLSDALFMKACSKFPKIQFRMLVILLVLLPLKMFLPREFVLKSNFQYLEIMSCANLSQGSVRLIT